jgi:glutathione S-transferase
MKLYYDPISTTSRPIVLFLAEHPLPVELSTVSLFAGENQEPAYAAINPNQAVPTLVDGDFVLTESSAILKHLAELAGAAYPKAPQARARVNQLMDWFNTGLYRDFGYNLIYPQVLPDYRFDNPATQADVLARAAQRAAKWLRILDTCYLAEAGYLCGDEPTIADYLGACYVTLGDWIGYDLSPYPNVSRWLKAMRARPSWDATHGAFDALVAQMRQPEPQPA